jgi:hypothetical protein
MLLIYEIVLFISYNVLLNYCICQLSVKITFKIFFK